MQEQTLREPVHLLLRGAFAKAVAEYLSKFRSGVIESVVEDDAGSGPENWPSARISIVVASRPSPDLCSLLDTLSHKWQRPFVSVEVNSSTLSVGPIVIPGEGSCWGCWRLRHLQHSAAPKAEWDLWDYYASHLSAGPKGYLEPFALMAATQITSTIDLLDSFRAKPGYVWQIDMLTRRICTGTAIGAHDCPLCGLQRHAQNRTYDRMQNDLSYLWRDR